MNDGSHSVASAIAAGAILMTLAYHVIRTLWQIGSYRTGVTTNDSITVRIGAQAWLWGLVAVALGGAMVLIRDPFLAVGIRGGLLPILPLMALQWYWGANRQDVRNLQRRITMGAWFFYFSSTATLLGALWLIVVRVVREPPTTVEALRICATGLLLGLAIAVIFSVKSIWRIDAWRFVLALTLAAALTAPLMAGPSLAAGAGLLVITIGVLLGFISIGAPHGQNRRVNLAAALTAAFSCMVGALLMPLASSATLDTWLLTLLSVGGVSLLYGFLVRTVACAWERSLFLGSKRLPFG